MRRSIKNLKNLKTLWVLGLVAILAACGAVEDPNNPNPNPNPSGPDLLPQTYKVSECGGFTVNLKSTPAPAPLAYCDAEVLKWTYDKATGKLSLSDNRVLLNCCGDRKVTMTEVNGIYEILETDAPEQAAGGARCHCMCVFDLAVAADKIAPGVIDIKLKREITDDNSPTQVVYTGKLDLTKGAGEVVLDTTDVGGWCSN